MPNKRNKFHYPLLTLPLGLLNIFALDCSCRLSVEGFLKAGVDNLDILSRREETKNKRPERLGFNTNSTILEREKGIFTRTLQKSADKG